jgi:hypothetical protein
VSQEGEQFELWQWVVGVGSVLQEKPTRLGEAREGRRVRRTPASSLAWETGGWCH